MKYKFVVSVHFKDGTSTMLTTYDNNEDGDNILSIDEVCYNVIQTNKEIVPSCVSSFPIKNNIKEMNVYRNEIKEEIKDGINS